jgi:hypothetical protein
VTPLTGGPDDSYAPAIDSAKTYPSNGQLNFSGNVIDMRFNEFIKLNNANDNIIIIPQQTNAPEFYTKNKRLRITLNDEMLENTTYTITFNGAIQDITERNDSVFQYVFSTGNYIDSIEIQGFVKDAFANKGVDQMLVGLYPKSLEAHFDSIPFKYKPMYLGQTDGQGKFKLNYLKDGTYYIFAIDDKNKNLLYDKGEAIGFIPEKSFLLTADEANVFLMRSFTEESDICEVEDVRFTFPGKLEVILTNPTDSIEITSTLNLMQEETGSKDSLVYWLAESPQKKTRFFLNLLGDKDTLKPIYEDVPEKIETVKLKHEQNVLGGKLLPKENLILTFSEPVKNVDMEGVRFLDVDSNVVIIEDYEINIRELVFPTFGTSAHEIIIDSGAVISVFDRATEKEINITFDNEEEDYYGTLIVSVDTSFNDPVIVHLLDKKGEVVDTMDFSPNMRFEKLLPGDYQLRLIFDMDNSGDWTSGSLAEGRLAEEVIYNGEMVQVKSKWEKEIDWKFKQE